MRRVRSDAPRRADDRQLRGVPALRPAPQARRAAVARAAPRRRPPRRVGRAPRADRSARVLRRQGVPRSRRRGAADLEGERGDRDRAGEDRGAADRLRSVPLRLHGGLDGVRRGGEGDAPLREGARSAPPRRAPPRLGRSADAGGDPEPHADGEDGRRARAPSRRGAAVHQRAPPPDDGRRSGELRAPRRREHRGAQGAHRLRRPARHREHDPPDAPRGVPAERVSPGARDGRLHREPPRHARAIARLVRHLSPHASRRRRT